MATVDKNFRVKNGIDAGSDISSSGVLKSLYSAGDEGGEIQLSKSVTNTTINTGVTIDIYQNKLRFFESGGTNRGYYIDITSGATTAGTNLVGGGGGGGGINNTYSATAPTSPTQGDLWTDSDTGALYTYVNDGTTSNWLEINSGISGSGSVPWVNITSTPTTLSGYGITDAQPLDADLTAIAALTGTSGFLKTNGSGTWSVDTATYLTSTTGVTTVNGSSGAISNIAVTNADNSFSTTQTASRLIANTGTTGTSNQGAFSYGTLGYSDQNLLASFVSGVNTYNQIIVQNTNNTGAASAAIVINNNRSTSSAYYGEFGMNSQSYTGSGSLNLPDAVYLTSTTSDLVIGTTTANSIRFIVNSGTADTIVISSAGNVNIGSGTGGGTNTGGLSTAGKDIELMQIMGAF